jgi:outer membrane protein assembly factor BamB
VALAGALLGLVAAGCEWDHVGAGPTRDGHNPVEATLGTRNVASLVEAWSSPTGSGDPVVAGGTVYVNSRASRLTALDASTGAVRWSFPEFDAQHVTPGAVHDGVVFVGVSNTPSGFGGWMTALDAGTGDVVWEQRGPDGGAPTRAPLVTDGVVYAPWFATCCMGSGPDFEGQAGWDEATGAIVDDLGVGGSALAAEAGLLFLAGPTQLRAFDVQASTSAWSGRIARSDSVDSSPAVGEGFVYVGTDDSRFYAFRAPGCGATTCDHAWRAVVGGAIDSSPAVADGVVYVGTDDGFLYAFRASGCGVISCQPLWRGTTGGAVNSSPAVANGVVYVGSDDGHLHAFRAGAAGCGTAVCAPLWSSPDLGAPVTSSPAVANGRVHVGAGTELHTFGLPRSA